MKKYFIMVILGAIILSFAGFAKAEDAMFIKRLKVCSTYTGTFTFGQKTLTRKIKGTMPVPTGLGCIYEQETVTGKTLKCGFPIHELHTIVSNFEIGKADKMLKDYADSGVCTLE